MKVLSLLNTTSGSLPPLQAGPDDGDPSGITSAQGQQGDQ